MPACGVAIVEAQHLVELLDEPQEQGRIDLGAQRTEHSGAVVLYVGSMYERMANLVHAEQVFRKHGPFVVRVQTRRSNEALPIVGQPLLLGLTRGVSAHPLTANLYHQALARLAEIRLLRQELKVHVFGREERTNPMTHMRLGGKYMYKVGRECEAA